MKKNFIDPLTQKGLHIITKMRHDANLKYLYHREQKEGKGRKRKYAGKVNIKNIDKSIWSMCLENDEIIAYEQILYCVILKRVVKVVFMEFKDTDRCAILLWLLNLYQSIRVVIFSGNCIVWANLVNNTVCYIYFICILIIQKMKTMLFRSFCKMQSLQTFHNCYGVYAPAQNIPLHLSSFCLLLS